MTSSNKKELGLFGEMTNSRTQGRNTKDEPEHLVEMQKIRKYLIGVLTKKLLPFLKLEKLQR